MFYFTVIRYKKVADNSELEKTAQHNPDDVLQGGDNLSNGLLVQ